MSEDSPQAAIKLEELKKTKSAKNLIADDRVCSVGGVSVQHTRPLASHHQMTTELQAASPIHCVRLKMGNMFIYTRLGFDDDAFKGVKLLISIFHWQVHYYNFPMIRHTICQSHIWNDGHPYME